MSCDYCLCYSIGQQRLAGTTVSSAASVPLRPAPTPPGGIRRSSPSPTMGGSASSILPAPLVPS